MFYIIGSGLVGISIGYNLIKEGHEVTIFGEENTVGQSSIAAVGMLAPLMEFKPGEENLFNLMLESNSKWEGYAKEIQTYSKKKIGFKKNSSLLLANNNDEFQKLLFKKDFFKKFGFNISLFDAQKTLKSEPNLSPKTIGSLLIKNQDQVNPLLLKKTLIEIFLKKGSKIENNKKVEKLIIRNNKVGIVSQEKELFGSKVIIAAGSWSRDILLNSFNVSIPIRPVKGVSLKLSPRKNKIKIMHNLWFRNIYVAPRDNGDLIIGATEEENGFDNRISLGESYFLIKNIWESLPFTDDYEICDFKSGLRPASYDGLPYIGTLSSISKDIICAFGHYRNGVLLAPVTAEIVKNIIKKGKSESKYKYFLPERF